MDIIEAGLTLQKEDFNDYIKEPFTTKIFFTSLLFDCLVLVSIYPLCLNKNQLSTIQHDNWFGV